MQKNAAPKPQPAEETGRFPRRAQSTGPLQNSRANNARSDSCSGKLPVDHVLLGCANGEW